MLEADRGIDTVTSTFHDSLSHAVDNGLKPQGLQVFEKPRREFNATESAEYSRQGRTRAERKSRHNWRTEAALGKDIGGQSSTLAFLYGSKVFVRCRPSVTHGSEDLYFGMEVNQTYFGEEDPDLPLSSALPSNGPKAAAADL